VNGRFLQRIGPVGGLAACCFFVGELSFSNLPVYDRRHKSGPFGFFCHIRREIQMANRTITQAVRIALVSAGTIAAGLQATPVVAQEQLGEIMVTGSRISHTNLTSPTAVTPIDADVISQTGAINVADVLRAVPSFGVSTISTRNSNFQTASSGINTLQLRGLGEDRTLVLVNGRRYISGLAGSAAVDFNTIPTELISRVEVITGGASAVYGSDALAGVINVILKDDFEGVQFGYQFGQADAGGEIENRFNFTAGGNFADGRGNGVVSALYTEQKGTLARSRSNTRIDDLAGCYATGHAKDCTTPLEGLFSSFSEYGRFSVPSTGEQFTVAEGTGSTGTVVPFDISTYGFNRQQFRRYTVPTERYLISSMFDYDMGGGVNAFVEATFAQTRTTSEIEPFPHSFSDLGNAFAGIPVDNPFVPQDIRDAVLLAGDTTVEYRRRMTEIGLRGNDATRDTYRFVLGFEGEIAEKWNWETFYAYGRMDDNQTSSGQINVLNMEKALNVIDVPGDDPICADPNARAQGCVPINLFGRGSISPEAANYVRAPQNRQQFTQQETFGADVRGPLFDVPAGPVEFAFGVEYRHEKAADVPDVLTQQGLNGGNKAPPTFGAYNVGEAFAEFEVPLLKDVTGVHDLTIGGAYRYSDYSTVDQTDAYTGRISWAPIESLRFRAQYARAVRAPNIGELFSPGGEDFATVADPCNGIDATTPGDTAANCRSIQAIADRIAATGSFDLTLSEIQGTGGFNGVGNPNLGVETSDSWSFGTVFEHQLGRAGAMTLSVDYFTIDIDTLIDTVGRQDSLDFCFNTSDFPNEFCSALVRDTTGPTFQLGELTEVNNGYINEGTLKTEGIDVALLWNWELAAGQGSIRMNYTHLLDYTLTKFGVADDVVGETGASAEKGQMAFVYSTGPWSGTWEWTFLSSAVPDDDDPLFNYDVGHYSVHDLQVGYDFSQSNSLQSSLLRGARLYAGVNNVFDEDAPIVLNGVPGNTTGTDTDANVYDPIGRTWYVGLNITF